MSTATKATSPRRSTASVTSPQAGDASVAVPAPAKMTSPGVFKRFTTSFMKAREKDPKTIFVKVAMSKKTGRISFGTTNAKSYKKLWTAGTPSFNAKFVFVPGLQLCGDLKAVKVVVDAMFGALERPSKSQKERMRILKSAFTLENHTDSETRQEIFQPVIDEETKKIVEIKEAVVDDEKVSFSENFKKIFSSSTTVVSKATAASPKVQRKSKRKAADESEDDEDDNSENDEEVEKEVEEAENEEDEEEARSAAAAESAVEVETVEDEESSDDGKVEEVVKKTVKTTSTKQRKATTTSPRVTTVPEDFSSPLPPVSSPRRGVVARKTATTTTSASSPRRLSPRRLPKDWALLTPSTRLRVSQIADKVKTLSDDERINLKTMRVTKAVPKGAIQIAEEPKVFFMPQDVGHATSYIALTRKIPLSFARAIAERAAETS